MAINIGTQEITLNDVMRTSLDGLLVLDRNRRVIYYSQACERMTGVSRQSVLGSTCACYNITGCQDEHGRYLSGILCPAVQIFNKDIPHATQRMRLVRNEDQVVWVETNYTPIFDERGEVSCVVGIMRDVTFNKEKEDEFREWAERNSDRQRSAPTTKPAYDSLVDLAGCSSNQAAGTNHGPLDRMLSLMERREIMGALSRARGQRTLAAKLLGISRSRLYRRMDALEINPRDTANS